MASIAFRINLRHKLQKIQFGICQAVTLARLNGRTALKRRTANMQTRIIQFITYCTLDDPKFQVFLTDS